MYTIYTDGGCACNPDGPGGCAAVIINEKTGEIKELSSSFESTTNNRMEIMAVILAPENIPSGEITLYSDSQYVIRTMMGEYRKTKISGIVWIEPAMKRKFILNGYVVIMAISGMNGVMHCVQKKFRKCV